VDIFVKVLSMILRMSVLRASPFTEEEEEGVGTNTRFRKEFK
jgi:hypothetical protein